MAVSDDLIASVNHLADSCYSLQVRLAAYAPGEYDAQMQDAITVMNGLANTLDALAPTPEARALELKAVG